MALLHWAISESIFLARVNTYDSDHIRSPTEDIDTCGWSPSAVIISLLLSVLLILGLVILGMIKYPKGMPIVSSCSAAISANCHFSDSEDCHDMALRPVMFGVLPDIIERGYRRVGYSSHELQPLEDGEEYGPAWQIRLVSLANSKVKKFQLLKQGAPSLLTVREQRVAR